FRTLFNPLRNAVSKYVRILGVICCRLVLNGTGNEDAKETINWLIVLTCSAPNEIGKDSWRSDMEFEVFKLKWKAYEYQISKITEILNLDYKEVIKEYDSESTFFYL
ncbi:MAG: hypothetical protein ACKPKO_18615, partial [Candidatus Fonsibacter sp.]